MHTLSCHLSSANYWDQKDSDIVALEFQIDANKFIVFELWFRDLLVKQLDLWIAKLDECFFGIIVAKLAPLLYLTISK